METIKVKKVNEPDPKYRLKDTPFLKSKFLMMVGKKKSDTESEKVAEDEHQKQLELEEIERPPPDPQHGFRTHAWVVMIKNLPWCYKEEFKCQTNADDYDEENQEPMAFFIEPSTGFQHELTDSCYQGIESIWNHQNYFVNRQFPNLSIRNMRWNLSDTDCWEKFLPGEPYELRSEHQPDEDEDLPTADQILAIEKHLDMPISSWVDMLHINIVDYEERYVNGEKREEYKYSVYEKFAPYKVKFN